MRIGRRVFVAMTCLGLAFSTAGLSTYAAFTATSANAGNSVASGTVRIEDNDGGGAMLSLVGAVPGSTDTSCIRVRYTGSLTSRVRLYASVTGSLAQYLQLTVTRGTSSSSFDSCGTFAADSSNYLGVGAGVIYSGTLSSFPSTYAAGIVDPTTGSPESWTNSEEHTYRFVVTLNNNTAAQNLSSTAAFTWEARNA